ncbi:MAG: 4-hydroxybenzoate octaprenyltransferase [Burkholderiales bacterium]|nr:4-hydroxybenzoate octaprenyltransferase [Burkholderiales bacterium]
MRGYLQLIRFDKPIGTLLLLWPTIWALLIAYNGLPPFNIAVTFILGVFLTRSAGCAINDFADVKYDGKVARTSGRPLVSGVVSKKEAIVITCAFSVVAFLLAMQNLKTITLFWSIPALFLFITYPFFKRFFPIPQLYLGIAFSFGILMAFVEARGGIPLVAIFIFVINLLWVLAYDTIYALVDIHDDRKINMKTSALTFGRHVITIVGICYLLFLSLICYLGVYLSVNEYYWFAIVVVAYQILTIMYNIRNQEEKYCFQMFLYNNNIGIVITIALLTNYLRII